MTLPVLRRILNDTPGTATDIDYNDQTIETYVNTEVIQRDGSVAFTAAQVGVDAVQPTQLATLSQVESLIPVGIIWDWGGDGPAPAGWALCDGGAQSSTDPTYQPLFNVIGTKFGDAGGGNFNLPDYRGKVSIGVAPGGDTLYDTIGKTGGQRDSELLAHVHVIDHGHSNTLGIGTTGSTHTHTTASAGTHDHDDQLLMEGKGPGGFTNATEASDLGGNRAGDANHTISDDGAHTHTVTTTGSSHTHNITGGVASFAGDSAETGAGTTLTDKNFQPFVVVNKIIKL